MRRLPTSLLTLVPTLLSAALMPAAPATAAALGTRPLAKGDRGKDVADLQRTLRKLRVARLGADGVFGRNTRTAVRRYERRERLNVDGKASVGQLRGILRRAGRPMPSAAERPPARVRASAAGTFPIRGEVRWGDGFGERTGGHDGIDLLADCGTPLVSVTAAKVRAVSSHSAAGRYVLLTAADGREWVYMHLERVDVKAGDTLATGERVGTVGRSGNATACHLHAELWSAPGWQRGGRAVDPEPTLRALAR